MRRSLSRMIVPGAALPKTAISGPVDPDCLPVGESTTQVSIIDAAGNIVSLTQTLGQSFGAKVATPGLGFIYNNLLASFRFDKPHCPSFLRPRGPCPNDMAPTIVVEDGGRLMALGTPGSNRIPSILAGVISNVVDRGMGLGAAIEAPRILWGGSDFIRIEMEIAGPLTDALVDAFDAMGYEFPVDAVHLPAQQSEIVDFGGVNAAIFDPAVWELHRCGGSAARRIGQGTTGRRGRCPLNRGGGGDVPIPLNRGSGAGWPPVRGFCLPAWRRRYNLVRDDRNFQSSPNTARRTRRCGGCILSPVRVHCSRPCATGTPHSERTHGARSAFGLRHGGDGLAGGDPSGR